MTAVAEDLDLSWVTFTDEPAITCLWRLHGDCPREPVAAAVWDRTCHAGAPNPQPLCAHHRDQVARAARVSFGQFRCKQTGTTVVLLRIGPLT